MKLPSVIRTRPFSDSWFCSRYQVSPYRGCRHGCLYCDGRAEKYYVEGSFDQDITSRDDLPGRLTSDIRKLRERGYVSLGSGVTDAYQPLEAEKELTRQIASILLEYRIPAVVLTKSVLALRDLDLWSELSRTSSFHLLVSFSTLNEEIRKVVEPNASSVNERLDMIRRFRDACCPVSVLAMPLLPGISDTGEDSPLNFPESVRPDCIMPSTLTLRPGRQKDLFLDCIRKNFPEKLPLYKDLYRENRASGSPLDKYCDSLYRETSRILLKKGIPPMIPHRIWKGHVSLADEISFLLAHMDVLYSMRKVDTKALKKALLSYEAWIKTIRTDFNRRRSLSREYLDDLILMYSRNGSLSDLFGNEKLGQFFRDVLEKGMILDYINCRLDQNSQ